MIEQDHRFIKRVTRPMLGFKSFASAAATLEGIEVAHMIRKGQLGPRTCGFRQFAHLADQLRPATGGGTLTGIFATKPCVVVSIRLVAAALSGAIGRATKPHSLGKFGDMKKGYPGDGIALS